MDAAMFEQWEKERRVLLDTIQNHPSQDLEQARDRLVILNKLLQQDHGKQAA